MNWVKDSIDFKKKIKSYASYLEILLLLQQVVALYPSILHEDGIETLRERPVKSEDLKLPASVNNIVKMTKFILKYNIFEFHGKVNLQISGKEIGSKFAPPFVCIYIDEEETEFF